MQIIERLLLLRKTPRELGDVRPAVVRYEPECFWADACPVFTRV